MVYMYISIFLCMYIYIYVCMYGHTRNILVVPDGPYSIIIIIIIIIISSISSYSSCCCCFSCSCSSITKKVEINLK
jgi:hypothetical protein